MSNTSGGFNIPWLSKTLVKDSTSLVFATGSMPLLIMSWIQSHALSRNNGIDMNFSKTITTLSLTTRWMSIHEIYFPITSRHIQVSSGLLLSKVVCSWKLTSTYFKWPHQNWYYTTCTFIILDYTLIYNVLTLHWNTLFKIN